MGHEQRWMMLPGSSKADGAGRGLSGRSLNKVTSEDILSLFRKPSGEGLRIILEDSMLAYRLFGAVKAAAISMILNGCLISQDLEKLKAKIEKTRSALVAGAMHCLNEI
uniref:Uncharacterized protein n=1 Tax=Salmonella sp. TaxID=599 RepID=A0A482ETT2_SALSP|nr:hypothetical protein [Salmonella sp.]QBM91446.1 hypothetical protein NNIBIDOC_00117 [Salmonella sp.]